MWTPVALTPPLVAAGIGGVFSKRWAKTALPITAALYAANGLQRRGSTPQMIGRYPDYDVFDAVDTWDTATKKVVLARLEPPGPLRFFTADEEPALRAFCDTVLAQDREPRVPVAERVDAKLADGRLDGYQYADMPDDRGHLAAGAGRVGPHRDRGLSGQLRWLHRGPA